MLQTNLFNRLRPLHRSLISLAIALSVYLLLPQELSVLMKLLIAWIGFALCYLILCWMAIYTLPVSLIKKNADKEDGSKTFVFSMILLASFASMFAVVVLISKKLHGLNEEVFLPASIAGMLFSWLLVHTIFVFHYAHMYYKNGKRGTGLDFPGDEEPDYMDFAYFSFVMGCTFQVSDVAVSSKAIRRTALFHGMLAFALNTFVVALTINIIAGLMN